MATTLRDLSTPKVSSKALPAYVTQFKLLLTGWISHFNSLGYIKDSTMEMLDKSVAHKYKDLTVRDAGVREAVGTDSKVWDDLFDLFHAAELSLEQRAYGDLDPAFDGPSSTSIVANSASLLKDLYRLDCLIQIIRNVLIVGEKVQTIVVLKVVERQIFSLINLCVRVTARGYDGEGNATDEDKWQGVINGFKKLLISLLQCLNNLITKNEGLKMRVWAQLFDSSAPSSNGHESSASSETSPPLPGHSEKSFEPTEAQMQKSDFSAIVRETVDQILDGSEQASNRQNPKMPPQPKAVPTPFFLFAIEQQLTFLVESKKRENWDAKFDIKAVLQKWKEMPENERAVSAPHLNFKIPFISPVLSSWKFWVDRLITSINTLKVWGKMYDEKRQQYREEMDAWLAITRSENRDIDAAGTGAGKDPILDASNEHRIERQELPSAMTGALSSDMESATEGMKKLREGKQQLLKRLESLPSSHQPMTSSENRITPEAPPVSPKSELRGLEADMDAEQYEGSEDEDPSDDDDYAIPEEDGRGLLTDVPLILGPNEIEVLPIIIMNGLINPDSKSTPGPQGRPLDWSNSLRCHVFLTQENGRNLLRELLIFVAAWDLREEEMYFKFMIQITQAILNNGLLPFAYTAFKESKDIISPAQSVIMKLLTKIFHSRGGFIESPPAPDQPLSLRQDAPDLTRVAWIKDRHDVQIVHCLFSEFRQNIVPQICVLIFLQGQIRHGRAHLQDFPLNLWDMERIYEGVYQYLEFFAILTDHEAWKQLMTDWEMTSELLTLLRELEVAIPKKRNLSSRAKHTQHQTDHHLSTHNPASLSPPPASLSPKPKPVSVERPFDVGGSPTLAGTDPSTSQANAETPPPPPPQPQTSYSPIHDEPADFEWRNLKKLCILVLSSLVWKNRALQDQVRLFSGIPIILCCCERDEHNPYIREHAIMCLRFLVEENDENAAEIRKYSSNSSTPGKMAVSALQRGREHTESVAEIGLHTNSQLYPTSPIHVPPEVLDTQSYETFIDAKGQVGLRRRANVLPLSEETSNSLASVVFAKDMDDKFGSILASGSASGLSVTSDMLSTEPNLLQWMAEEIRRRKEREEESEKTGSRGKDGANSKRTREASSGKKA